MLSSYKVSLSEPTWTFMAIRAKSQFSYMGPSMPSIQISTLKHECCQNYSMKLQICSVFTLADSPSKQRRTGAQELCSTETLRSWIALHWRLRCSVTLIAKDARRSWPWTITLFSVSKWLKLWSSIAIWLTMTSMRRTNLKNSFQSKEGKLSKSKMRPSFWVQKLKYVDHNWNPIIYTTLIHRSPASKVPRDKDGRSCKRSEPSNNCLKRLRR
jgi:hypothetical protein